MIQPYPYGLLELDEKRKRIVEIKRSFKVNDKVEFLGDIFEIARIDGHTFPICLGGGIRVRPSDVRKIK